MAAESETLQRIKRLTPLADVLRLIAAEVTPVPGRAAEQHAALGRVLAEDVFLASDRPAAATALLDGFAVCAELTADASSYAPAPLPEVPPRVAAGEALPAGADAVVAIDAIVVRGAQAQALVAATPGDGVLPAGVDGRTNEVLRRAGERLRASDLAALAAAGVGQLKIRVPRARVVNARGKSDRVIDAAVVLLKHAVEAAGGEALASDAADTDLETALRMVDADAVIAVGGTGSGIQDRSVQTLARVGRVAVHGIGLSPGETAALGFLERRPVLLVPGRIDSALAVWLAIGARMLARLTGAPEASMAMAAILTRKVASPLGLAEVVPVRCNGRNAEPIASGYWPLGSITQADGWILIAPESEGYPAGAEVVVRPLP
jgi:molybdopterin molybdotransferase